MKKENRINSTKTALITGASRGLGLALARALAKQGWNLIIDARSALPLEEASRELSQHTNVAALAGDIYDARHRFSLAEVARELGGIDAVINNAGTLGSSPLPPLLEYPLESLEYVFRVNVVAQLGVLQAVWDQLKQGAVVINVTSDAAVEAYEGWGGYGTSKAALEQMTSVLAAENPRIHFYSVDPGDMRTEMHQQAYPGEDISDRPLPDTSIPGFLFLLEGNQPSGRYQARELVAEVAG